MGYAIFAVWLALAVNLSWTTPLLLEDRGYTRAFKAFVFTCGLVGNVGALLIMVTR